MAEPCEDFRPCPWKKWGNSVLAINGRFWKCSYCGELIKDNAPFQMMRINGSPTPYIFDQEFCMIKQIQRLESDRKP